MSKYNELVKKLKEIFQIDRPELDFGIYRILNARADEINDYLDNKLKAKIQAALKDAGNANKADLEQQLQAVIKATTEAGFEPDQSPKVQALKKQIAETATGASEHENAVFSHLLTFFSRYYDNGDFISKRRYKGDTYAIPYAGEEVMLHWANKDQYYIKSGENFANYAFKLDDGRKVSFKLLAADTAKDNRKDNDADRRFVLIEPHTRTKIDEEGEEFDQAYKPVEVIKTTGFVNGEAIETEELVIHFEYKAMKKGTKQDALVQSAITTILSEPQVQQYWAELAKRAPTESNPSRTELERHLTTYTQRNTADYFIHKDLGGFLTNELDFYIKNEVMNLDNVQNAEVFANIEKQLRMIQCLRSVAQELITFLAQLENFQKKLWNKKKFIVSTDYILNLGTLSQSIISQILDDKALFNKLADCCGIKSEDLLIKIENNQSQGTTVDTVHLSNDDKAKLINHIGGLDDLMNGVFFWSDNYHALNLLKKKYANKAKGCYIDPPYNTENDGFIYKDSYRESSWLTMMSDRLSLGAGLLASGGSQGISIDLKEIDNTLKLCDEIYGDSQRRANVAIKRGSLTGAKMINPGPVNISENLIIYSKSGSSWETEKAYREKEYDKRYSTTIINVSDHYTQWEFSTVLEEFSSYLGVPKSKLKKHLGEKYEDTLLQWVMDNAERIVQFAGLDENAISNDAKIVRKESIDNPGKMFFIKREGANDYYIKNGSVMLFYKHRLIKMGEKLVPGERLSDLWDDVLPNDIHTEGGVTLRKGKKPEKLIHRFIELTTKKNDLIIDYFGGSGTTASVALKSGRRFITVDQQDFSKLRSRILNTINGDVTGVSKICNWIGGGIAKYHVLESYEDTLNNISLSKKNTDLFDLMSPELADDYLLKYMLGEESKSSLLSTDNFRKPFSYQMDIATDSAGATERKAIDLVETFNYLIGLHVKSIESNVERGYVRIEGKLPTGERTLILWRDCDKIGYDKLNEYANRFDLYAKEQTFDVIYINGDHNLPTAFTIDGDDGEVVRSLKLRQIEPEFLSLMFAEEA